MANGDYKLQYEFIVPSRAIKENTSFMVSDVSSLILDEEMSFEILHIKHFSVDENARGKGLGKKVLKDFCESHPDKVILVSAGVILNGIEDLDIQEGFAMLAKVVDFYEQVGFKSINDFIGYEYHEAMVYGNEPGMDIFHATERFVGRVGEEEYHG